MHHHTTIELNKISNEYKHLYQVRNSGTLGFISESLKRNSGSLERNSGSLVKSLGEKDFAHRRKVLVHRRKVLVQSPRVPCQRPRVRDFGEVIGREGLHS